MMKKLNGYLNIILPLISVLCVIAIWSIAAKSVDSDIILPSLSQVFNEFINLFADYALRNEFLVAFFSTLLRSIIAFAISFGVGFALAVVAVKVKWVKSLVSPLISIMRALPTIAIVLFLVLWTNSQIAPVVVTMLVVLPTTFTQIENAFFMLDKTVSEAGRVDGATELQVFMRVEVPQALPSILSAIGSGISLNFKLMVAAEVIAQTAYSMGYMLNASKVYYETARMFALVFVTVLFGIVIELIFNRLVKISSSYK